MRAKANIRLEFASEAKLNAVLKALEPEVQRQIGVRAKTKLTREDGHLILNVEAEDTVALRAALNAYLRWINSAVNVLEAMENKS